MASTNDSSSILNLELPVGFGFDVSLETGEIVDQIESPFERQKRNFLRRAVAQEIMSGYRPVKQLLSCGHSLGKVQVWKALESRTAHFSKVQTCGNPWLCGVCSPKISVRRGQKAAETLIAASRLGLGVALSTLTLRHTSSQTFTEIFDRLSLLFKRVTAGRFGANFHHQFEIVGSIRVIETTHGLNGWHPHIHQLIFFAGLQNLDEIRAVLLNQWTQSSAKLFKDELSVSAVDVRDGRGAALYVSKMGLEAEIVGAPWKQGTGSSATQFQLLDATEDEISRNLFREFAEAVCRPGEKRARTFRQIVWSRGLAKKLGLDEEKTDELLANEQIAPARFIGELTPAQWRILTDSGRDAIPNVLRLAAIRGWADVESFIELLKAEQRAPRSLDSAQTNAAKKD